MHTLEYMTKFPNWWGTSIKTTVKMWIFPASLYAVQKYQQILHNKNSKEEVTHINNPVKHDTTRCLKTTVWHITGLLFCKFRHSFVYCVFLMALTIRLISFSLTCSTGLPFQLNQINICSTVRHSRKKSCLFSWLFLKYIKILEVIHHSWLVVCSLIQV